MSTHAAISRANGALSQGPVTPEGKARSARNALRHGMNSAIVVLPDESREEFDNHLAAYVRDLKPADLVQRELVETMAASRWRLNRLIAIETQHLANELEKSPDANLAEAFSNSANHDRTLSLLVRYEGQINRTYERAFKQLMQLQSVGRAPALAAGPQTRSLAQQRNEPSRPDIPTPIPVPDLPDSLTNASNMHEFEAALVDFLRVPTPKPRP